MKRRIIAILEVLVIALCLCGCEGGCSKENYDRDTHTYDLGGGVTVTETDPEKIAQIEAELDAEAAKETEAPADASQPAGTPEEPPPPEPTKLPQPSVAPGESYEPDVTEIAAAEKNIREHKRFQLEDLRETELHFISTMRIEDQWCLIFGEGKEWNYECYVATPLGDTDNTVYVTKTLDAHMSWANIDDAPYFDAEGNLKYN